MKGHVETIRSGYHKIILELGRDAEGKRSRRTEYYHGRKSDAERRLVELLTELEHGTLVDRNKMSIADYLDRWLTDYAEPAVAASTYKRYCGLVKNNINPHIGAVRLSSFKPMHAERLYRLLRSEGRVGRLGGLSEQTVLHVHRLLSKAFKQALRWGLITRNPMDMVNAPSVHRQEMNALDTEESLELLEAAKSTRFHVPILLALATGARRGELLALRWSDIDFESGTLSIVRSLTEVDGKPLPKSPKTRQSSRTMPLPAFALAELRTHRSRQSAKRLALGAAWNDLDLVFCAEDGDYWKPGTFSVGFSALMGRLGIPIRFHDLRHSAASQLLKMGVAVVTVSQRLGHSSPTVTHNHYSHVLGGMQDDATRLIEEAYGGRLRTAADLDERLGS